MRLHQNVQDNGWTHQTFKNIDVPRENPIKWYIPKKSSFTIPSISRERDVLLWNIIEHTRDPGQGIFPATYFTSSYQMSIQSDNRTSGA